MENIELKEGMLDLIVKTAFFKTTEKHKIVEIKATEVATNKTVQVAVFAHTEKQVALAKELEKETIVNHSVKARVNAFAFNFKYINKDGEEVAYKNPRISASLVAIGEEAHSTPEPITNA